MIKHGMVAFSVRDDRLVIHGIKPIKATPDDLWHYRESFRRVNAVSEVQTAHCPDQLLQHYESAQTEPWLLVALGRVELALKRGSYKEAHAAINTVQRDRVMAGEEWREATIASLGLTGRQGRACADLDAVYVRDLLLIPRKRLEASSMVSNKSVAQIVQKCAEFIEGLKRQGNLADFLIESYGSCEKICLPLLGPIWDNDVPPLSDD